jgi:LysR family transcriptional regulator, pca operon transcriptional activator
MISIGYRHVRCFLEVARLSSVGQAAEALAISQPAVSKTLRELEERLGTPLFDREGRGLRLNAAGRLFQVHAGQSLAELERGVRALARPDAVHQIVVAGVLPTVATDVMPRAALAFAAAMPGATLRVSTGPNWLLLSQLREARLDVVVGRLARPDQMQGLAFEQLYSENVAAVVRPGHPLVADRSAGLTGYPLIAPPPGAIIRPLVEQYFLSLGVAMPRPLVETVSLALGRGLVRRSDAVWFISEGVVAAELAEASLVALDLPGLPAAGPVGITLRAGAVKSEARAELVRALRASV